MASKRCPRCFTKITDIETGDVRWTDDPIKTPKGEAGEDYVGLTYIKPIHIQELQELRTQQEIDVGIAEEDRTVFTPVIVEGANIWICKKHLRELRESTEKILAKTGQTKEEYFNYDEEATEYNIGDHQLDWHDIDLDQHFLDIKAVHIEDLRHYLSTFLLFFEDWTEALTGTYFWFGYDPIPSGHSFTPPERIGEDIQGTDEKIWTVQGTKNAYVIIDANLLDIFTQTLWDTPDFEYGQALILHSGNYRITENTNFTLQGHIDADWYDSIIDHRTDSGYMRIEINTTDGKHIWIGYDAYYASGGTIASGSYVKYYLPFTEEWWGMEEDFDISVNLINLLKLLEPTITSAIVNSIRINVLTRDNLEPSPGFLTLALIDSLGFVNP